MTSLLLKCIHYIYFNISLHSWRNIMSTGLFNVAFCPWCPHSKLQNLLRSLVWRSGCVTGFQRHLIPHPPQRPQGGEPPGAAKLSISVFLPLHIPLNPHAILPPITSVCYLSHYTVPVRLFWEEGFWETKAAREIWAWNNTSVICLDLIWRNNGSYVEWWAQKM